MPEITYHRLLPRDAQDILIRAAAVGAGKLAAERTAAVDAAIDRVQSAYPELFDAAAQPAAPGARP